MGFLLSEKLSAKNVNEAIALINQLRNGKLVEIINKIGRCDIIILDSPINYPFRPVPERLVDEINAMGEIVLTNGAIIDPSVRIEPPVAIFPNAWIGYSSWIRSLSIIGSNCKIANVETNRSVIGNGTMCSHGDYIGYSYISSDCRIGGGFKSTTTIFEGVAERPKSIILRYGSSGKSMMDIECSHFGCILESCVLLGCNTTTMPGTYLRKGKYLPNLSLGGKRPGNRAFHMARTFFSEL
ncbi:MAG: hypothetical protein KAT32_02700 [Candidatus Moranbacteria bacterium]|nr:hypothetical protein [Candidatus Moranbacteria bacterium]